MPPGPVAVLKAAYEAWPWPTALYDELGRLTGIAVRFACVYAGETCPEDESKKKRVLLARAAVLSVECERYRAVQLAPLVPLRREAEKSFRASPARLRAGARQRPLRREVVVKRRRVRSLQDPPVQAASSPPFLLARASGADRRTLKGVLDRAGVRCFQTSASVWVPLSEIELKVPRLWGEHSRRPDAPSPRGGRADLRQSWTHLDNRDARTLLGPWVGTSQSSVFFRGHHEHEWNCHSPGARRPQHAQARPRSDRVCESDRHQMTGNPSFPALNDPDRHVRGQHHGSRRPPSNRSSPG